MYSVAIVFVAAQASLAISSKCEKEWPTDFEMQEYCIKQQVEGQAEILEYVSRYNVDLDNKSSAASLTTAEVILVKCFSEWDGDNKMIAYCIEKQEESALRLGKLTRKASKESAEVSGSVSSYAATQVKNPPPQDMVMRAEQLLHELGFLAAEPDGVVGGDTVAAVLDYQAANQLKTTGDIDADLIEHMAETLSQR